jgi:hypothetical protein
VLEIYEQKTFERM